MSLANPFLLFLAFADENPIKKPEGTGADEVQNTNSPDPLAFLKTNELDIDEMWEDLCLGLERLKTDPDRPA